MRCGRKTFGKYVKQWEYQQVRSWNPKRKQNETSEPGEIPVMHKYRKLDKSDQFRVQGYMDALLEKQDREKSTS